MRAFISINIDEETKKKIREIQNDVKSHLDEFTKNSIKWEEYDKFHITLFFLGDVIEKQISIVLNELNILDTDKKYGKMNFKGTELNAFPNLKNPRVLIIELINAGNRVFDLYEDIYNSLSKCGFKADKKFHPHITLGRVRKDKKIRFKKIEEKKIEDLEFVINDFFLMESKIDSSGSKYNVIKKYDMS
jgi:RNA 2',3'-cyclic 3'-phosphodiesterase